MILATVVIDSMRMLIALPVLLILATVAQGHNSEEADEGAYPLRESSVEINGIDLHYRLVGAGSPLLLLHGFSTTGTWWNSLIEDLATRNTLIIPDLPAHGRSSRHDGPYLYAQVAQDLFALMDHLDISEFNAIGHSAGGQILLHLATKNPSRVKAMILISSAHRIPDEARDILAQWPDLEDNPPALQEYWQRIHSGGDEQIRSIIKDARSLSNYNGNVEFTADQLIEISARTLIVVGDGDGFVPLNLALEMRQAIYDSNIWVIPSQGHSPIWPDMGGSSDFRTIFPSITNDFLHDSN
jgi:pimeloyl-ACP methyl ester carboxylesterase